MNEVIYYATEEDMFSRMNGSIGVDWKEVRIIGTQYVADDQLQRKFVLVETIDGGKRFTTKESHMFTKVKSES